MTITNCSRLLVWLSLSVSFLFYASPAKSQIDTAVFNAIKKCDLTALQKSIKINTNINAVDSNGANALMWAVYYCDLPVVRYLVQQGAKVPEAAVIYFKDDLSPFSFHGNLQGIAVDKGKLLLLQYLADSLHLPLEETAYNPVSRKKDERGPLFWAIVRNRMDVINFLLARKKEKIGNKVDNFIKTAGEWAKTDPSKRDLNQKVAYQEFILELAKEYLGEEHIDYARTLAYVSYLYSSIAQYNKALALHEQALAIFKKLQVQDNRYYQYLNHLAYLYTQAGKYQEAIGLQEQALSVLKKQHGEENKDYAALLANLGIQQYISALQYEKALLLLQKALVINKKVVGDEDPDYAYNLIHLGNIYTRLGQYNKALGITQQAVSIYKKALGEEHPKYLQSLHAPAYVYLSTGQYDKALPLFQKVIAGYKKIAGEENPEFATLLHNLAGVYKRMEQFDKALPLYEQALAIRERTIGKQHPSNIPSLNNLASLYQSIREYDKAVPLLEEAINISTKYYGDEYQENAASLINLSISYRAAKNISYALSLLTKASNLELKNINRIYSTLSEEEKINLMLTKAWRFNYLPSLIFTHNVKEASAHIQLYQNELLLKGIVLQSQQEVISSIRNSGDSSVVLLYEQWRTNNQNITKQLLLPLQRRARYLDSLQEVTTQQEQALSRYSAAFRNQQQNKMVTTRDIIKQLAKDAAAVEFVRFGLYDRGQTDSIMYAAMVLLPNDSIPHFIYLFEEKQLQKLLHPSTATASTYTAIQNLYTGKQPINSKEKNALYELIWKPMEKYLQGIKTVYYAPAGLLHRIAFSALPVSSKQTLIEKYQLHQLLSTRSVATPIALTQKLQSASVWGNIAYDVDTRVASRGSTKALNKADTITSSFNLYTQDTRSIRSSGWRPLPASKIETDSLKKLFTKAGIATTAFSDVSADEEAFKSLSGKSPQVLHLATHGFFLPMQKSKSKSNELSGESVFTRQQNPMFRSGLVLAGGNQTWKGEAIPNKKEDGILTAFELSQMDLSNTSLVTLSACETALGDINGTEGVIGLQRALKIAGVKQMVLSLWQVPDKATMELMTSFYKNWLSGQSTREALRSAQLQLKQKYPSPYFWAAFVLVE